MDSNKFENLTPEAIAKLQELHLKMQKNEIIDAETLDAMRAIDLASKVINTIMSGAQVDPIFFKKLFDSIEKRFLQEKPAPQKIIKKKKLNYKSK